MDRTLKDKRISFRADEKLRTALDEFSNETGMTVGEILRRSAIAYMEAGKKIEVQ